MQFTEHQLELFFMDFFENQGYAISELETAKKVEIISKTLVEKKNKV